MTTKPWEWTGEQDVILRRMWNAGKLLREIAPVIGCNVGQVANRREVLGLRGRPARFRGKGQTVSAGPDYWKNVQSADEKMAAAMAGRTFDTLKVTADPRKLSRRVYDAGVGASSMELNA
jgi:hypothetical protein